MSNMDSHQGIGKLISGGRLRVPANQREYAWEEEHVIALFNDISDAIQDQKEAYFLGTVVLTKTKDGTLEVVDGQQRLATTTILFAIIRDMLYAMGEEKLVSGIENDYLFGIDLNTEEETPKLQLNTRDHQFYLSQILANPGDEKRTRKPTRNMPSNGKIRDAARALRAHLEGLTQSLTDLSKKNLLKDWLNYLVEKANLIVLTVPDDVNAYVMFETLNDRGLKVSQADLVKNYLFGQAGNRLGEAQSRWASMVRSLEVVDKEDTAIDYLRLLSTLMNGLTRERQVFEKIKSQASSAHKAVSFLEIVDELSSDYVAMLTPNHWKWEGYPPDIRRSVATLNLFGVTQIRHLMLAVAHHFDKAEAAKSFRLFVNWIVRLFIAGSGRIGRVESIYANLAHSIHRDSDIRTAKELAERMAPNLASDRDFERAFAIAHVGKSKLARYYLDALERKLSGDGSPDLVPNEDVTAVNLEHIMPMNGFHQPEPRIHDSDGVDEKANYVTRIGNLVLLNARRNAALGNEPFPSKRPIFAESPFQLTREVAAHDSWGIAEIESRQARLAKLAIGTWSLKIR